MLCSRAMPASKPSKTPWKKTPTALVMAFDTSLPKDPRVERRQMFGYPCAFTGGNMFTGLFQDRWFVRLSDRDRDELLRLDGAGPFEPMAGRAMKGYFVVPSALQEDSAAMRSWVGRALEYTASLPAKTKTKTKTKTKPKAKKSAPKSKAAAKRVAKKR